MLDSRAISFLIIADLFVIVLILAFILFQNITSINIRFFPNDPKLTSSLVNTIIGAVTAILIGGNFLFTNYLLKPLTETLAKLEVTNIYIQRYIEHLTEDVGVLKTDVGVLKVDFGKMLDTLTRIEAKLDLHN